MTTKATFSALLALSSLIPAYGLASCETATGPIVDLGYSVYEATVNASTSLIFLKLTDPYPYLNFSNIRFGEAPLGPLRFQAPIPPISINRTINHGQEGRICPQGYFGWEQYPVAYLSGEASIAQLTTQEQEESSKPPNRSSILASIPVPDPRTSEDCLFLDVIVPQAVFNKSRTSKAAVIFWLYGGGYISGDKSALSGSGLAVFGSPAGLLARSQDSGEEGVIYVAPNYRLGLFGWQAGATFEKHGTPNAGLFDQRLALEWVHKYIHLFGGDPARVTVMGESAGGGSAELHLTAYGGKDNRTTELIQRVVGQSPAITPLVSELQQESAYNMTLQYASLLTNRTISTFAELQLLSQEVLYDVNAIIVGTAPNGTGTFGPIVDGGYIPGIPSLLLQSGQFHHNITIMSGQNTNEGALFANPTIQSDAEFRAFAVGLLPNATTSTIDYVTDVLYPPANASTPYQTPFGRTSLLWAEIFITCNRYFLTSAAPNTSYAYLFSVPDGYHGTDVDYTFFDGDITTKDESNYAVNATLAAIFQRYLIRFAMYGDPNGLVEEACDGQIESAGNLAPYFPVYGEGRVMNINVTGLGEILPDTDINARCKYWQSGDYWK